MRTWHRTGTVIAACILAAAILPAQAPDEPALDPNILWQQRFAAPPLVRLSQDGQYLAYLVAGGMGVPVERDELGLVSVSDRRVVWSKRPAEGIRFGGTPVFDEQSHSIACSYYYLPEPGPTLPAEERGLLEFRGGIYVWSVDGKLELDIPGTIRSPEPGAQAPFWPIFMDSEHIVATQSVMEDVQGLFIFDREGNLLRQVGGEGQWVARQVAVSPDGSYLVLDGRDAIIMESMGGERLGSFPGHLFESGHPTTSDGEYILADARGTRRSAPTVLNRRGEVVCELWPDRPAPSRVGAPDGRPQPQAAAAAGSRVTEAWIAGADTSQLVFAIRRGLYLILGLTHLAIADRQDAVTDTRRLGGWTAARIGAGASALSANGHWLAYATVPLAWLERAWRRDQRQICFAEMSRADLLLRAGGAVAVPLANDGAPAGPRVWHLQLSSDGRYAVAVAGSTAYLLHNPAMQEEPQ